MSALLILRATRQVRCFYYAVAMKILEHIKLDVANYANRR